MQRRIDRTLTLEPDELRRAIWVYLKSMDIPVPADDDELNVTIQGNPVICETSVVWTDVDVIKTEK